MIWITCSETFLMKSGPMNIVAAMSSLLPHNHKVCSREQGWVGFLARKMGIQNHLLVKRPYLEKFLQIMALTYFSSAWCTVKLTKCSDLDIETMVSLQSCSQTPIPPAVVFSCFHRKPAEMYKESSQLAPVPLLPFRRRKQIYFLITIQ